MSARKNKTTSKKQIQKIKTPIEAPKVEVKDPYAYDENDPYGKRHQK